MRLGDERYERLPELASEHLGLNVKVLGASTPPAALAAKAATGTIPIVATSADPVAVGLVGSLARPGGNLTGLSYATALLAGKILDLLREISHPTRPVVALWYGPNAASAAQLQEL
jgi:putative tryptophan/tyrosine transport system substrate-binding protein